MDANRIVEFLTKEGFRPTPSDPGEVRFKYEGGNYVVRALSNDQHYVVITYPDFWRIQSPAEEMRALRAANLAGQSVKLAKVYILEESHRVLADAELLVTQPEQFEALFYRCLDILRAAVRKFAEAMRASEPLPDKRIELKRDEITKWMHGN